MRACHRLEQAFPDNVPEPWRVPSANRGPLHVHRMQISIVGMLIVCALTLPVLWAQKVREPLRVPEIVDLLTSGVSPRRVDELARQHGIAFQLTSAAEDELRKAGASEDLLNALRELAPKPPVLLIESTPGAQVYVDDVFAGKTSSDGRSDDLDARAGPTPHPPCRRRLSRFPADRRARGQ